MTVSEDLSECYLPPARRRKNKLKGKRSRARMSKKQGLEIEIPLHQNKKW